MVIDAHEWRGSPGSQRGELEISTHGNLNSYKDVRDLSLELAFDRVMAESNSRGGFRSSPYQELYGEPSRLRQIGGLKHALTLLTETSRHPEVRRLDEAGLDEDAIEIRPRRASATLFALSEAMRWMTENVDRVVAATNASEEAAKTNTGPLYTGGSIDAPPSSDEILDPPPCGWLVSNPDPDVTDILDLHGIEWEERVLPRPQRVGQKVLFVPAAQLARPLALTTLDGASPDQLKTVSSLRLSEDSGWCDPADSGDKTALQNRVTEIKNEDLNEADYTEESWQNLQDALTQAEDVLNDPNATQSEIDGALEALNVAREQLEEISPITASTIKTRVEHFEETGEFESSDVARALKTHLTAVERFEKQEAADKLVKHMQSFQQLLDHQKENELISQKAYSALYADADSLIKSWQ